MLWKQTQLEIDTCKYGMAWLETVKPLHQMLELNLARIWEGVIGGIVLSRGSGEASPT